MAQAPGFKFIDLPDAAQRLGITRLQLLEWIEEGKLKPFMGKGQTSVFRSADVERLARDMGLLDEQPSAAAASEGQDDKNKLPDEGEGEEASPRIPLRKKRRDPIKLIGTRLSMDSRWAEISDEDIATWLDSIEAVQFSRVRRVADITIERLNKIVSAIDADPRASNSG